MYFALYIFVGVCVQCTCTITDTYVFFYILSRLRKVVQVALLHTRIHTSTSANQGVQVDPLLAGDFKPNQKQTSCCTWIVTRFDIVSITIFFTF